MITLILKIIISIEKQMKIEFVDIIRNNKPLLKFYNLKRNDIENQLVNESVIEKIYFSHVYLL